MRCPVCQARFRGARICSRCGADLEAVMRLALRAWRFREAARRAIARGTYSQAVDLVSSAERLHSTRRGESLLALSAWLNADRRCASPFDSSPE
jgi:predicted amidophosphoribosyltransferase